MNTEFDAIIIGAGPAGSSTAILLARSGWRVALVEKQCFPRRKVCGECIAATNLPLLKTLGIGKEFFELAGPALRQIGFMAGDQMIIADFPPYLDRRHRWGVALGREHLDTLLLEQARHCGAHLFQPWAVHGIDGAPGCFHCCISEVRSTRKLILNAPVLIAAYGSWEPVPGTPADRPPPHRASDLFAFKANFATTDLERGLLPLFSFAGGYGGMVVDGQASTTLAFCMRRDTLAACRQSVPDVKAAEAALTYVAQHCRGVRNMLAGARQCGGWLGVGPLRPGIRIRQQGDGAFLVGNAAGEAHPLIGEGISMAIQSAWLLVKVLAPYRKQISDRKLQANLQRKYAHAWRQHFALRIHFAALFAHCAMRVALAGSMLPLLKRYPQILTYAAQWSGKTCGAPDQDLSIYVP